MNCWVLIAVKEAAEGKQRLTSALPAQRRIELIREMFKHVLDAARGCAAVDKIAVVTPEQDSVPADALALADPGRGMNHALNGAILALQERGAERVAILLADLPFVTGKEIQALITASMASGVAVAPDRHERGSNALCLALPARFRLQFGPDSFARHLAEAAALGIEPGVVRLPGLGFDVDEPADLERLEATVKVLV